MDKINVEKSQNNIIKVTSNNVSQLEKLAEFYANSAEKNRKECANYVALVQRILQECVGVKNEINISYLAELTNHIEDDSNPHKVTCEQIDTYSKSEVDELLENIDVTVDGISYTNLYEKTDVDNLLSAKADRADVYSKTEIDKKGYLTSHQDISGKVDKVTGKGLSTEDYTTAEKTKLAGLSNYDDTDILSALESKADVNHTHTQYLTEHQDISGKADINHIHSEYLTEHQDISGKADVNHTHPEYLTEHQDISGKANISDLSEVATSGDYDDLNNKPTIPTVPTSLSGFTDDLGSSPTHTHNQYLTEHQDISGKADINHTHSEYLTEHQDISGKVDKVTGKGLSTEDYTTAEKTKLARLSNYDDTDILSALESKADVNHTHSQYLTEHQDISGKADVNHTHPEYLTEHQDISSKANISDLSEVAMSGDYDDLTNKPTIPTVPTSLSGFTDDLGSSPTHTHNQYLTKHQDISGKADVNHTHSQYLTSHQDISGKQNISNLVTSISSTSTNAQYPSAKCVYDLVGNIETLLNEINGEE